MPDDQDAFARRHLRHNLVALGGDYALFLVGFSFASQSTILPAFAEHLRAPNIVIGAIPAVMTVGWYLPSLFAAGHTETLARRLPFVLRYTILVRGRVLVRGRDVPARAAGGRDVAPRAAGHVPVTHPRPAAPRP